MASTTTQERETRGRLRNMREPLRRFRELKVGERNVLLIGLVTMVTTIILAVYLLPMLYVLATALKSEEMIEDFKAPPWPSERTTMEYEGEQIDLFMVPVDGEERTLGLVQPRRETSVWVDPDNLEAGTFELEGVKWRELDPIYRFAPKFGNLAEAWRTMEFLQVLRNTAVIAVAGLIGTLVSSTLVAYGLSRFRMPFRRTVLFVLLGTIILPRWVTLVPLYTVYFKINWLDTWLPLIVPHFFANAYNVFLLRQYFLTIPKELDEAALIDGAGPLRSLWSVFLPQVRPALAAVGLFHFFFAWNDFFEPLIFLSGRRDLQPISVAVARFNQLYDAQPHLLQAAAILVLFIPVIIFFLSQRFFLEGINLTGVKK
jgi:multiple sugar transport system permease protein